ncbi:MAG: hypothetical protein KDE27_30270 [Planctomycetes bacterium]|nr:hypothetical protein [Planctomycetota bacterium]
MDPLELVRGIAPPVLVALALISAGGNRLLPLALGVGFALAFILLTRDWPTLPHVLWSAPNGKQWLFWGVVGALLVAALEHWRCLPVRVGLWLGIAVGVAAVWFLLSKLAHAETLAWRVVHVGGGGLAVGALVWTQRRLIGRSESSPFFPVFALAILIVDAVVVTLGRSALYGQICGALAAGLGAAIGTCLWRKPFTMGVADGTWLGAAHGLFLLAAVHLAYLTWPAALLTAIAPVLPLMLPQSFAKERPKRWMLVALTLAGLPAAGAIALSA